MCLQFPLPRPWTHPAEKSSSSPWKRRNYEGFSLPPRYNSHPHIFLGIFHILVGEGEAVLVFLFPPGGGKCWGHLSGHGPVLASPFFVNGGGIQGRRPISAHSMENPSQFGDLTAKREAHIRRHESPHTKSMQRVKLIKHWRPPAIP